MEKDSKFKAVLAYIETLRLLWVTRDPILTNISKTVESPDSDSQFQTQGHKHGPD